METTNVKKVFGYCRVSTIGQALDGDSLETQEQKIRDYCKLKNLCLLSVHKEAGVSGAIPPHQRPQLKLILANLEAGNGSGLVVCKIDRLSRSTKDFLNLMADFKDHYDFYSIVPDVDSSTTHGKFTMNLLSIVAELERDMTKDRVKEVMSMKKLKGERVGTIPFGKQLKKDSNLLEDNPEEQKTILMIKEMRATTTTTKKNGVDKIRPTTYMEICAELVKRKRLNKEGVALWHPSQIRRVLNEGSYVIKKNKK